jgi:hypothetical protein
MLIDIFCHDWCPCFHHGGSTILNMVPIILGFGSFTRPSLAIRQIVSQVKSQNGDAKVA